MSKPKDQKKSSAPEKECELCEILFDLHKNPVKKYELIEYLEHIPKCDKSSDFCDSYIILLFQQYIANENEREFLLAACGLLEGFEFKSRQYEKRMVRYKEHARGYNNLVNTAREGSSFMKMCRDEIRRIVTVLGKELAREKDKNQGKLGLIEDVPEKLELPKPKYTTNIDEPQRPLLPEETITIDMTQESKIEITKILPNGVKRIFHIAKTSTAEVKIIALLVLVIAISSFGTVCYVQNYNTQENEKKSGYTAEYSPKMDYTKDRKLTIPKGEPFEVDVATFRTYVQWLNNHPYLKEIRKTIWEILIVKMF